MFTVKNIPLLTKQEAILELFGVADDKDDDFPDGELQDDAAFRPYFEPLPDDDKQKEEEESYLLKGIPDNWYLTRLDVYCHQPLSPRAVSDIFNKFGLVLKHANSYVMTDKHSYSDIPKVGMFYIFSHVSTEIEKHADNGIKIVFNGVKEKMINKNTARSRLAEIRAEAKELEQIIAEQKKSDKIRTLSDILWSTLAGTVLKIDRKNYPGCVFLFCGQECVVEYNANEKSLYICYDRILAPMMEAAKSDYSTVKAFVKDEIQNFLLIGPKIRVLPLFVSTRKSIQPEFE